MPIQDMFDVLYTPLDCPTPPTIDIDKLKAWQSDVYMKHANWRVGDKHTQLNMYYQGKVEDYPWDLTTCYFNKSGQGPGWIGGFDQQFPELVQYIKDAFNVPLEEFGFILVLPVREHHKGRGFWHRDPDTCGLRMYINHTDHERNFLTVRRTVTRDKYPRPLSYDFTMPLNGFQDEDLTCKVLHANQCFYLNNIRAIHSTFVESPGENRVTLLFGNKNDEESRRRINDMTRDLIVRSAEKYKDYAVLWEPPKD